MAAKNSPWTPRFGSPSIQFMIIFQKNFQPRFTQHKYYHSIVFQPHYAWQIHYISFGIYYFVHTCTLY